MTDSLNTNQKELTKQITVNKTQLELVAAFDKTTCSGHTPIRSVQINLTGIALARPTTQTRKLHAYGDKLFKAINLSFARPFLYIFALIVFLN